VKHLKKAGKPRLLTANGPTDCCWISSRARVGHL